MRYVVFDSSFLMAVSERPTAWQEDITSMLGKYQPIIPKCVEAELSNLANEGTKAGRLAKVALQLSSGFARERCRFNSVDDSIISCANDLGAHVATVDRELIGRAKSLHIGVVSLSRGRVKAD